MGKTTLIKLLLGKLVPDSGTVKIGANVEIGYFDQTEQIHAINPDKSVMDNINDGSSHVTINGRDRHIVGYLKDFYLLQMLLLLKRRIYQVVSVTV